MTALPAPAVSLATTDEGPRPAQELHTEVAAVQDDRPPQSRQRARTGHGTLFRFDSVTELVTFCRARYRTDEVRCSSDTGEHLLSIDPVDGEAFESLIVHFEGEQQYAVLLPDLGAGR